VVSGRQIGSECAPACTRHACAEIIASARGRGGGSRPRGL